MSQEALNWITSTQNSLLHKIQCGKFKKGQRITHVQALNEVLRMRTQVGLNPRVIIEETPKATRRPSKISGVVKNLLE